MVAIAEPSRCQRRARTCKRAGSPSCEAERKPKTRFHRNQQYSITALTDGTGAIAERYAYTAYGEPTFLDGSGTVLTSSAEDNRYTYTGREWDEVLGLYHYRARMYDATEGRFISRDPIRYAARTFGLYEYVQANPMTQRDPFGLYGIRPDLLPCLWWIRKYLWGGDQNVDLHNDGLFEEWRRNSGVREPIEKMKRDAMADPPYISCYGESGSVSQSWSRSTKLSTQVFGVHLCSQVGPIGGSELKVKYSCTVTANCRKCKPCPDLGDSTDIFSTVSCKFTFDLEDQFSNPGDRGGAHNRPRDLAGYQRCVKRCERFGGRVESRCKGRCRSKYLIGNKVPVVTDPSGYPYFIRANWSESDSRTGPAVDCGT